MGLSCNLDLDPDGDGHIGTPGAPLVCITNDVEYIVGTDHPTNPCLVCARGSGQNINTTKWEARVAGTPCPGGKCDALGKCN